MSNCLTSPQDQTRALYAAAYEQAGDDTLLAPDCLPPDLDEQEQAPYAAFYSMSAKGENLTDPDNFLCLSPDERQLALYEVLLDLSGWEPETEFNPADYGTVALWLKADALTLDDEDVVNAWPDSGGGSGGATQETFSSQPVYVLEGLGSKPTVRFDGIDDYLSGPDSSALSEGTLFIVGRKNVNADSGAFIYASASGSSSHQTFTSGVLYDGWGSTERKETGVPSVSFAQPVIYSVRTAPGAWSARINGVSHYATASNTVGFSSYSVIGSGFASATPSTAFLSGDISEILVFSSALPDASREAVEAHLSTKYGIPLS